LIFWPGKALVKREISIRAAVSEDRPAFIGWAGSVEKWFGPMVGVPEFEAALDAALAGQAALVACDPYGRLVGGILIAKEQREIGWLVVAEEGRGRGAGTALLAAALELLGSGPVRVETFAEGVPAGVPALRLYRQFGFLPTDIIGATPAGIPTRLLERPPGMP
jgi:GNAT superfamily N-acetyltransferase